MVAMGRGSCGAWEGVGGASSARGVCEAEGEVEAEKDEAEETEVEG